jgi:hypothetical protein
MVYTPNTATRSCFFATDLSTQVTALGSILNSSLSFLAKGHTASFSHSSPLPSAGFANFPFLIVTVNSDGPDPKLEIHFFNGESAYKFLTVTYETDRGIVGREGVKPFTPLFGEPEYPSLEKDDSVTLLIVALALVVVAVTVAGIFTAIAFRRTEFSGLTGSNSPPDELYDHQEVANVEEAVDLTSSTEHSEAIGNEVKGETNPYDNVDV